ncbi:MAG: outer membrane protein OmpK, partial [Acinetobacter sp.]|nr:outer membrane protein OmpK [Acinetobacter sp.]
MKLSHIAAASALGLMMMSSAQAKVVWQDFSLSALHGTNYELVADPAGKQTTITAEYAAKIPYADLFAFVDRSESNDVKSTYFEVSPRLSLSETLGTKLQAGIIKDVLISTTWEGGENFNNYLYGVGVDLNLPKFQYASLNVYRVNNELSKDDWQLT